MWRCGQADNECGTMSASVVVAKNLATVLFQNSITNTQTEAGAFPDLFRGEERVENPVGVGDSVAVVAHPY